jgi:hypothetical protein
MVFAKWGKCKLRLIDFRVPALLPLKAVVGLATVSVNIRTVSFTEISPVPVSRNGQTRLGPRAAQDFRWRLRVSIEIVRGAFRIVASGC